MTEQLSRARADLASGRAWKARDRLHGVLRDRQDVEILDLLATGAPCDVGPAGSGGTVVCHRPGRCDRSSGCRRLARTSWERRGALAQHSGLGFPGVRKGARRGSDDDEWLTRVTPPDDQDRHVELAVRRGIVAPSDRVLLVDDWAAAGAQAIACQQLAEDAGAQWVGAAVIVDALENASHRRQLNLRGLLHFRGLENL